MDTINIRHVDNLLCNWLISLSDDDFKVIQSVMYNRYDYMINNGIQFNEWVINTSNSHKNKYIYDLCDKIYLLYKYFKNKNILNIPVDDISLYNPNENVTDELFGNFESIFNNINDTNIEEIFSCIMVGLDQISKNPFI